MTPPIVSNAGPILARYEAVFCDVWGVMHNGRAAYPETGEALARFRAAGGTVVLVSNAPVPEAGVQRVLERTGCGGMPGTPSFARRYRTHPHREKGYQRLHRVGPARRGSMLFARLPVPTCRWRGRCHRLHRLIDDSNHTVETMVR